MQNTGNYAHSGENEKSKYVKYRGTTGQIDVQDTIINIVSNLPGLMGVNIANMIYDKRTMPLSHGYVYKVLKELTASGALVRSAEKFYYLSRDAFRHDMEKTLNTVKPLIEQGQDIDTINFALGGIVMLAEDMREWANDREFDPMLSEAFTAISLDEPEYDEYDDGYDDDFDYGDDEDDY